MISHVCIGISDMERAARFYTATLAPLGWQERAVQDDGGTAMRCWHIPGRIAPRIYLVTPIDGGAATAGNGSMTALIAPSREAVNDAYRQGLDHGGTDAGPPGVRRHYAPDYYGAYLHDPDGNKLHFVHTPNLLA
ncbi:VOC family protein [Jannaschia sp. 2305UL9-9]|uniref:VOC family protein n=1 Tax=Jannaschia sp. 2305UL9-9 TaxID=3121638 RepID=UPI0035295EAA